MSARYEITILAVHEGRVVAQFEVLSPDVGGVVDSEDIALQLIVEAWEELARHNAPMSALEAHPRADRLFAWQAMQTPREAITAAEHEAETTGGVEAPTHPEWGEVSGWHSDEDGCARLYEPRYEAFYDQALAAIPAIGFHSYHEGDDSTPTTAVLVFDTEDPDLVSHLGPGLRWRSAMYDYESWLS